MFQAISSQPAPRCIHRPEFCKNCESEGFSSLSSFKKKPLSVFNSQTTHASNLSRSTNYKNVKHVRFNDINEKSTKKQIDNTQNTLKIQSNTKSNDNPSLSTIISSPYEDLKKSAQKLMMNQFAEAEELSMIVILLLFLFLIYFLFYLLKYSLYFYL